MGRNLRHVGTEGERVVRAHLEHLGWRIVAMNFRCSAGEMDLIAEQPAAEGTVLVFVEVKTRAGGAHGAPSEAVDTRKRERLRNIALAFLSARDGGGREPACRFDVAEVRLGADGLSTVRLVSGIRVDE